MNQGSFCSLKNKRKEVFDNIKERLTDGMEDIPEVNYPFVLYPKDFAYYFENSCLYPISWKLNKNYWCNLSRLPFSYHSVSSYPYVAEMMEFSTFQKNKAENSIHIKIALLNNKKLN